MSFKVPKFHLYRETAVMYTVSGQQEIQDKRYQFYRNIH